MTVSINKEFNRRENERQQSTINTTLYELIDAVNSSIRSDEDYLTGFIVSHILNSGNVRLSKNLV